MIPPNELLASRMRLHHSMYTQQQEPSPELIGSHRGARIEKIVLHYERRWQMYRAAEICGFETIGSQALGLHNFKNFSQS